MADFANLTDAGRHLGRRLREIGMAPDALALPVLPNGVPVVIGLEKELALAVVPLRVSRGQSITVPDPPPVQGRTVLVVDDGVESGSVARAVVGPLRGAGAARVILAVPAGPPDTLAELAGIYDEVIAVAVSSASLASHFTDFDTIGEEEAEALLAELS